MTGSYCKLGVTHRAIKLAQTTPVTRHAVNYVSKMKCMTTLAQIIYLG